MIKLATQGSNCRVLAKKERLGNAQIKLFFLKGEKIMKKRRTLVISLLLIAALALGIGYAALSRELMITSAANLSPDQNDFDIVFISATVVGDPDNQLATASVTGTGTTANYTVTGLSKQGDTVTLEFVVENKTADVDANLTGLSLTPGTLYIGDGTATTGNSADYFEKTVTITKGTDTYVQGQDFVLEPGDKATVTVVVTLKQTITQTITLEGATVHLNFASVE